jgi:hypothetical protein
LNPLHGKPNAHNPDQDFHGAGELGAQSAGAGGTEFTLYLAKIL